MGTGAGYSEKALSLSHECEYESECIQGAVQQTVRIQLYDQMRLLRRFADETFLAQRFQI
jgi:hypothetical protein